MKNDTRQWWREIWPVEWVSTKLQKRREKMQSKTKSEANWNSSGDFVFAFLHQTMQLLTKMCAFKYDNTKTVSRLFQKLHCDRVDALTRRRFHVVFTFATATATAADTYTNIIYWLKLCRFIGPIVALGSFLLDLSSRECGKNHVN